MSKISVIVPCHNVEKYLPKCLESLIGQTFHDIDIVAVENASTDGTMDIIKKYASSDTRIKVLTSDIPSQQNARRMGICATSGEYIMFCDADDWYAPDMCEVMYKAITESGADIACCDAVLEYDEELSEKEKELRDFANYYSSGCSGIYKLGTARIMRTNVFIWNKIMRRDIVEKILPHYLPVKIHDDCLLWYLYALNADSIFYVNKQLYHYLLRPNSIMSRTKMSGMKNPCRMEDLRVSQHVLDYVISRKNPTETDKEFIVLMYTERLKVMFEQLDNEDRTLVLEEANRDMKEKLKTRDLFVPLESGILDLYDCRSLPVLLWQGLMLKTHKKFNRLVGKRVSGSLERKILVNDLKIGYKKNAVSDSDVKKKYYPDTKRTVRNRHQPKTDND